MDTRMQDQANRSPGLTTAMDGREPDPDMTAEELQQELAKWQARVPKLAGALRERTNEVQSLKAKLDARGDTRDVAGGGQSSGIEARDALIEELEAKVKALGGKHQDAEGQLHARDLEIAGLREDATEWREKWQSVTTSLDAQSGSADQKDRELARARTEADELLSLQTGLNARIKEQDLELTALRENSNSLESRNEKLFETTELANRQIETLGDNLEQLRADLKARNAEIAGKEATVGDSVKEIEDLKRQISGRDQDIEFLHGHVEEKQQELTALSEKVSQLESDVTAGSEAVREQERLNRLLEERDAEISSLTGQLTEFDARTKALEEARTTIDSREQDLAARDEELASRAGDLKSKDEAFESQKQEIRRLEECVAQAEEANDRWEVERRQLSEQMDELKKRNQHLEDQLSERSDLVVGLEQEKSVITDRTSSLEDENSRLSEALEKAQQHSADNADHIAQVDSRLDRQKQLMENLEEEFAQVQEEFASAVKSHQREINEKTAEIAKLQQRMDEDSVETLKEQLTELETSLQTARDESKSSEETGLEQMQKAEDLARELDQRKSQDDSARQLLQEKVDRLEKQLRKQSKATTEAEEVAAAVRAELETQKTVVSRVPDEVSVENDALQAEVIKLEGMVRERTEQMNKLRWQQDMIEKQSGDGSESKMLVVLNQQLVSAREDNQRLLDKVRDLENRPQVSNSADDLSSIRGIGPKLVKQLSKLGITRFDQIATLSEADLDDEKHPLHGMKGRIIKDAWIDQAAKLGGAA